MSALWVAMGSDGKMAPRWSLETHFQYFWALVAKRFPDGLWMHDTAQHSRARQVLEYVEFVRVRSMHVLRCSMPLLCMTWFKLGALSLPGSWITHVVFVSFLRVCFHFDRSCGPSLYQTRFCSNLVAWIPTVAFNMSDPRTR